MTEYKWCQRCGGESFGKEFCMDCRDRLMHYEKFKKENPNYSVLGRLGIKN